MLSIELKNQQEVAAMEAVLVAASRGGDMPVTKAACAFHDRLIASVDALNKANAESAPVTSVTTPAAAPTSN